MSDRGTAELLASQAEAWTAIEIRVHSQGQPRRPGFPKSYTIEERYIETVEGHRLHDNLMQNSNGDSIRSVNYCDGEKCALVIYDRKDNKRPKQVSITHSYGHERSGGRTTRPAPMAYWYLDQRPLSKALLDAKPSGPSSLLGRECAHYEFPGKIWGLGVKMDLTHDIDKATGIPLKMTGTSDGRLVLTYEALSLKDYSGHQLPAKSHETIYGPEGQPVDSIDSEILEVKFDGTYPKSMFWPTITDDMLVFDNLKKSVTHPKAPPSSPPAPPPAVAELVIAEPPRSLWDHAGPIGIGLGIVVLLGALAVAIRRARSRS